MAKKSKKSDSKAAKPAETPEVPMRAVKVPVALRFNADLLAQIDKVAMRRGMSRNAIISYWCSRAVEAE
ncbi:MAG: hypothetical protein LPK02_10495 [Rhodobacterales bacterium]|nr:hypothetical protein [Rhodobacterales bacterium]MDX5413461.1 hypothetical protein [Rhodobacterales bacterium]